jgi:DNA mismatch repair protein MutS
MTLKGEGKGPLPPLLQQYVELIEQYPDYLVLFQVGDFYECFGENAEKLSRLMGIYLTQKTSNNFITPMSGIPIRSADTYIEKLLKMGVRVAVADQVENPLEAEGLVKRDITQLITPGTVTDEKLLPADANYLAAVATGDGYGLALLDVSTGEFRGTHLYNKSSLYDELQRYRPAEVLLAPELHEQISFRESFGGRFPVMFTQKSFGETAKETLITQLGSLPFSSEAVLRAASAVLSYALETQRGELPQVTSLNIYDAGAYMHLDEIALTTLEVFDTPMNTGKTLFSILDETRTAPGRRLLKAWLRHPLLDQSLIETRLDAVEAFVHDTVLRQDVRKVLFKMHDLERLATRLAAGRATARDLTALSRSLALLPEVMRLLDGREERALQSFSGRLPNLQDAQALVDAALVAEPPIKITEGGLIRDGFDADLDTLRHAAEEGRSWLAELELRERETTAIPTLKVGFNGVFGYYLEVTRPYYEQVPKDYRPIQTLKDRQRYSRPDIRDKEREILRAEDAAKRREYNVFEEVRSQLTPKAQLIRDVACVLAELDVYSSLAEVAAKRHYCRPTFSDDKILTIRSGRHPVVEEYHRFIANDAELSGLEHLIILTGPNMSGKSTYLRQTALTVLLAQIGSFVPAEAAGLPLFDRIFTRIGAADDIAGGRSTFMVEMSELARILQNATPQSLILLDEIGRGTSTYDGLALAWAASEYLHNKVKAFTLFATHYFELTTLASQLSGARNHHVAAKEEAGGLIFYHQVLPGPASKAYGLEVAKLAGVPAKVLERASSVFAGLEASKNESAKEVIDLLLSKDVSRLSPLEALNLLNQLQEKARGLAHHDAEKTK